MANKSSRSEATSRGNFTRRSRRQFSEIYGSTTASVIRELARGVSTSDVADFFGISTTSVATYKANMTRGVYSPYVYVNQATGEVVGNCNW